MTFSPRITSTYQMSDGLTFEVTFSADAEIPQVWESPKSGQEGILIAADGKPVVIEATDQKVPRTHWDMLLERRTRAELEELLNERLGYLRARKGQKVGA